MAALALTAADTRSVSLAPGPPMPPPPPAAEQWLAALPTAVACARRFVRDALERWHLHSAIPAAEQAVAELVTDAVRTTGVDVHHPEPIDLIRLNLKLIKIMVSHRRDAVLIEVWDTDSTPPEQQIKPKSSPLRTHYLPDIGGKVVRVELPFGNPAGVEDSDSPTWTETNPIVLQRILDRLRELGPGNTTA